MDLLLDKFDCELFLSYVGLIEPVTGALMVSESMAHKSKATVKAGLTEVNT